MEKWNGQQFPLILLGVPGKSLRKKKLFFREQRELLEIDTLVQDAFKSDFRGVDEYEILEKGHDRIEHRKYWMIDAEELPSAKERLGLKSIGFCIRERTVKGKMTKEEAFFATSLELDAKLFSKVVQGR